MADASSLQTSFLGGEWSPLMQGRADDQRYKTGMNRCRNTLPIQEGAAVRRQGFRLIGPTRGAAKAVLREFHFDESHPYNLELTAGHVRIISGTSFALEAPAKVVTVVTAGNPGAIGFAAPHGWSVGDELLASPDPVEQAAGTPNTSLAQMFGRVLVVLSTPDANSVTLGDAMTGDPLDMPVAILGSSNVMVGRLWDFDTVYTVDELEDIRIVQGQTHDLGNFALLLHPAHQPAGLESQGTVTFDWSPTVSFTDGPYFDPPNVGGNPDGSTITPSGTSGAVELTLTQGSTVPTFAPTDVGRSVRLFSEPVDWDPVTAWSVGDQVTYNGGYYQALEANTNVEPDSDITKWGVATGAAVWMWATITAFIDATHVDATLHPVIANGITGNILPRTDPCTFRMGVYSDTTGWPTNGLYSDGRLWLAGAQPNRMDGSVSNSPFDFTPTAYDGTVADNNGISAVFNAKDSNAIYWMVEDALGIIAGSKGGEWLISASNTNDPITPTSIQARRRTQFGCANTPAYRAGLSIVFVQRFNRTLLEYITTDYRALTGRPISETGKHLINTGVAEIAYTQESSPIIWARTTDGTLRSCTYERTSAYADNPPDYAGWAQHDLGNGMSFVSIQAGPNYDGTLDSITAVITDGTRYWNVLLTDQFDTDWQIGDSCFVDFATFPAMWQNVNDTLKMYCLHYLAGATVDVFLAGIDYGQLVVSDDGELDATVNGDNGASALASYEYLNTLASSTNFHGLGMNFIATGSGSGGFPGIAGFQRLNDTAAHLPTLASGGGYPGVRMWVNWGTNGAYSIEQVDGANAKGSTPILRYHNLINYTEVTASGSPSGELGDYVLPISIAADNTNIYVTYMKTKQIAGTATLWSTDTRTALIATYLRSNLSLVNVGTPWSYPDYTGASGEMAPTALSLLWIPSPPVSPEGSTYPEGSQCGQEVCVIPDGGPTAILTPATLRFGSTTVATMGVLVPSTDTVFNVDLPTGYVLGQPTPQPGDRGAWVLMYNAAQTQVGIAAALLDTDGTPSIVPFMDIAVSTISAGWTSFLAQGSIPVFLDQTDGHLCFALARAGGTGPTAVLVKVNLNTSSIQWVCDLSTVYNTGDALSAFNFSQQHRITNGKFMGTYLDGSAALIYGVDLATGVLGTRLTESNFTSFGGVWAYDDFTGAMFAAASWGNGSTVPRNLKPPLNAGSDLVLLVPITYPNPRGNNAVVWQVPAAIGYSYTSQGQVLRALAPAETGAANGPALGKTRRSHQVSFLFNNTQGVSVGTDFVTAQQQGTLRVANFRTPGNRDYPLTQLFSGVHWSALDDSYSFDSMVSWQVTRPYPVNVCAVGPFLHTQDR